MSRSYRNDLLALTLLVAVPLTVHRAALGFYADDWSFLRQFAFWPDQDVGGYFRVMWLKPSPRMRPGHALYAAVLYRLFGTFALGYHLVNAAVLVVVSLLLYLVLRRLRVGRSVSVGVALLYSVLPHYSTDRVWLSAFQAPLSVAFYLAGVYGALASLRAPAQRAAAWLALSTLALLASGLCYELTIPLFLLHPLLLRRAARAGSQADGEVGTASASIPAAPPARVVLAIGLTFLAAASLVLFKLAVGTRVAHELSVARLVDVARQVVWVNAWHYGLAAPRTVAAALPHSSPGALAVAGALALLSGAYLTRVAPPPRDGQPSAREGLGLIAWGGAVIALGHAIILADAGSSWPVGGGTGLMAAEGRANRVAIVGAAGAALALVGAAAVAAAATPARLRRASFAWLVAAFVAGAFVVDAYLRSWWETAYGIELATVAAVRRALPQLPRGAVVLVDGACQEVGAGVAFHSPADLRSALTLAYGDTTLRADVVRPTLTVRRDGVHTKKWGENVYPYARLVLFDVVSGSVERPADSAAAESYFARQNPRREQGPCPGSPLATPHALVAPRPPAAVPMMR